MTTSSVGATGSGTTNGVSTDIYNRVQQVMASQSAGATKLNNQYTSDQTKLSALGQMQSALAAYQTVAQGLTGGLTATTFPTGAATATTSSTSLAGSYALNIQQLAQGQFLTSPSFQSPTAKIGSGAATTITVDYGTDNADGSFTANSAAKSVSVSIDSSDNTPAGIAAALQQAGVNAQVVTNADGSSSLSISGPSGAANSMRIGVSGDADIGKLLGYDPSGTQNMTQTTAAQDAKLTVAGVAVTSATNTVSDAVDGVTLNLTATGSTSLQVAESPAQVTQNVNAFVSAYNALNSQLQTLQQAGLGNDPAVKQVSNQISQLLKTGGSGVSIAALKTAGVTQDSSGNLQVDSGKLAAAVNANPTAVGQLISDGKGGGLVDQLNTLASGFVSANGVITHETTSTNADYTKVTAQRTALTSALTAQANALAALYTAQAAEGSDSTGGTATSLFDMLG